MSIDYNQIYNQLQTSEALQEEEERLKNQELAEIYAAIHGDAVKTEEEPLGYKENIGNVYAAMDKGLPTTVKKKRSLTELANDDEFATVANRFLESIGSNDNIFEYLRDAEYSLASALVRAKQANQ